MITDQNTIHVLGTEHIPSKVNIGWLALGFFYRLVVIISYLIGGDPALKRAD